VGKSGYLKQIEDQPTISFVENEPSSEAVTARMKSEH
jgi:hypothetical protein